MLRGAFWWRRRCPTQSDLSRPLDPHRLDGAPARGRLASQRLGLGAFDGWVGALGVPPHLATCLQLFSPLPAPGKEGLTPRAHGALALEKLCRGSAKLFSALLAPALILCRVRRQRGLALPLANNQAQIRFHFLPFQLAVMQVRAGAGRDAFVP